MGDEYISRDGLLGKLCRRIMIPQTILEGVLADIPSADVAPVRHGEWKFDNETVSFFCSECNAEALLKYVVYRGCIQELSEYCPNCGARMDGEDDEID